MKSPLAPWYALGFLLAAAVAPVAAAPRRPITHEDLWLMKRVGPPVPSPDGKWVAFVALSSAYDPKDEQADLWICPADGSTPARPITRAMASPGGLAWSRDSAKLAFAAKREGDEAAQIYILDWAQGGDAERVTHQLTGARTPLWSPDGASILFISDVLPDNPSTTKAVVRTYNHFPIRFWDHWLDDKRPHLFVQEPRAEAKARDLLAGTRLAATPGYAARETEAGNEVDVAWAPDGKSVVFAATTTRDVSAYALAPIQLFAVPAAGGEPRQLTEGTDSYAVPAFRPDGGALLCKLERGGDGQIYHHARIASFPWPFQRSGRRVLTGALDLTVGRFAVSADSRTAFFTAETDGHERLFSVPTGGGPVRAYGAPQTGGLSELAIGGATIAAAYDSATSPPEVVRLDPETGALKALTAFNAARLAELDLPPAESFTFTSAKGRPIQSFVIRPPDFTPSARYPLLVVLHGGPASMSRDGWSLRWNYALLAAPGYVVLTTNYSGSTGFGETFGQAIQLDPLKTPGDEINQAADVAIKRYAFIDARRQAAAGASYGPGTSPNWLEATTTRYRCLVAHAGLVNLESQWATSDVVFHRELAMGGPVWEQGEVWRDQNPVRLAGNHFKGTGWVTPILLSVGEKDARVPMNNTIEKLDLPAAAAESAEPAAHLPGREPLDLARRGQPGLVRPRCSSGTGHAGSGDGRRRDRWRVDPTAQPGGQVIWRFASRCTCRWGTLSQASGPLLITRR